jgi:hypothetical protein
MHTTFQYLFGRAWIASVADPGLACLWDAPVAHEGNM